MLDTQKGMLRETLEKAIRNHNINDIIFEIHDKNSYLMYDGGHDRFLLLAIHGKNDVYDKEELALLAEKLGIKHNLTS